MQANEFGRTPDTFDMNAEAQEEEVVEEEEYVEEEEEEEEVVEEEEEEEEEIVDPNPDETFVASKEDLFPTDPFKPNDANNVTQETVPDTSQMSYAPEVESLPADIERPAPTPTPAPVMRGFQEAAADETDKDREELVQSILTSDFRLHACAVCLVWLMLGGAAAVVLLVGDYLDD